MTTPLSTMTTTTATTAPKPQAHAAGSTIRAAPRTTLLFSVGTKSTASNATSISRPPPGTSYKPAGQRPALAAPVTTSRISVPRSRLTNLQSSTVAKTAARTATTTALNSRSPSVISSIPSATAFKRPSVLSATQDGKTTANTTRHIPDTNLVRKGLAKFSNPIECQRQFHILNEKIKYLNECAQSKQKENDRLRDQLEHSFNYGVGYATVVQYFAEKLKLHSNITLPTECELLKARVSLLEVNESQYEQKLESVVDVYKQRLQVEQDLKENIKTELEETRIAHSIEVDRLKEAHKEQVETIEADHSNLKDELENRITELESELSSKCKELSDLHKNHEELTNSFNKLEESLTKDKDARVKYAQEKISQLQKDVESLNSVLEMRLERIHALEKDSLLLAEAQSDLSSSQDTNKALKQQIESLNAALEKKRRQFEDLIAEHEKVSQELKRERKERRRMIMKTEELEYALNESCASESNLALNSTVRDVDGADHVV